MTTTVNDLRFRIRALPANARRKEVAEIAFELEYLSLLASPLPTDIFSLYLEVLSDPLIFSKNGIDNFIFGIYNEFDKLTPDQEITLLESMVNNSKEYNDEKLRFSVGDMIARKYPIKVALGAFRRMWFSGEKHSQTIAQFGVDVLSLVLPKEGSERDKLRKFGLEMVRKEK
ncbi:hypothetical protein BLA17378_06631 [Burkholderia aenigmatica]|uniref:Uncharacterized protein n=1 Tax=Burkholderia aenigmatica TaxID=2015348 RepID=A0ABY6Y2R2_9BURK|nr:MULTISPECIES: hypothetical protein [Burkholderia]VWD21355.1 hypothetical protein BLA17378_06631 [Burkholderia aenigmatica]VWD63739.1 hypothetical protein BLA18628_07645 [Burkholderia aenigmatica]